jgi:hypothetical protein
VISVAIPTIRSQKFPRENIIIFWIPLSIILTISSDHSLSLIACLTFGRTVVDKPLKDLGNRIHPIHRIR